MAQVAKKSTTTKVDPRTAPIGAPAKPAANKRTVKQEPAKREHKPITKADYPAPGDELILVSEAPKGLGADQRRRWEFCQQAAEQAKADKVKLTAEYLAKAVPDGRRTLRRAVRAGLFANWEYRKGGDK